MSRVDELVRSMTWDEKLAQMQVVFKPNPAQVERWVRAGVGAAASWSDRMLVASSMILTCTGWSVPAPSAAKVTGSRQHSSN